MFCFATSSLMDCEGSVCIMTNILLFVSRFKSPWLWWNTKLFMKNERKGLLLSFSVPKTEPSGISMSFWLTRLELAWRISVSLEAQGEIREALEEILTIRRTLLFPLFFQPISAHFNLLLTDVIQENAWWRHSYFMPFRRFVFVFFFGSSCLFNLFEISFFLLQLVPRMYLHSHIVNLLKIFRSLKMFYIKKTHLIFNFLLQYYFQYKDIFFQFL